MEVPQKRRCPKCGGALEPQKPIGPPFGWYVCPNEHKYHLNHSTGRQCDPSNPTDLFGDPFDPYEGD